MPHVPNLNVVDNLWIYGEPRSGKSFEARRRFPDFYSKGYHKWWDMYQGESTIIIDDWELPIVSSGGRTTHEPLAHLLKIWADAYEFPAEVKGGAIRIRPQHVVVTSNYTIDDVFGYDAQMCAAIHGRFSELHWTAAMRVAVPGPRPESPSPTSRQADAPAESQGDVHVTAADSEDDH